jgi:hypothetical protein
MRRALLTAVVFGVLAAPTSAAEYVVNQPGDAGDGLCGTQCTIRDAVETAAQNPGRDTIRVPSGTFQLSEGPLQPNGDIVAGAGSRATIIRSDGTTQVFVVATANNEIAGVTLTNGGGETGSAFIGGGAVHVATDFAPASLTLRGVSVSGSHAEEGGGIRSSDATLTIVGSTISGNLAASGGAPLGGAIATFGGTTTIVDSTISSNAALDEDGSDAIGGGLYSDDGAFVMRNVTLAANRSDTTASVHLVGTASATMSNVIMSDASPAASCGGNAPTDDHSIADDSSCGLPVMNPQIGPLANNGGQTNTHALAATSPAINAAAGCSTTDQRGVARDGVCDIGAFEFFRPRLTVVKRVVNDQGGTLAPGDFSVHVRAGGADVGGSPQPGTAAGRTYVLGPGTYTVGEDADDRYVASFSGACNATGAVSLSEADVATCTISNADKPPVAGEIVNAEPARGTVRIKLPNRRRFRVLREGDQLPVGTVVDTLNGRVTLFAAANKKGGTSESDFYDGIFKLSQTKGSKPITVLKLVEKLTGCKSKKQANVAAKKKKKRRLWGNGSGRFRTRGKHSAATVVGTKWLVQDRCKSTLTRVVRGRVRVRDFVKDKNVIVRAGKKYVARRRP